MPALTGSVESRVAVVLFPVGGLAHLLAGATASGPAARAAVICSDPTHERLVPERGYQYGPAVLARRVSIPGASCASESEGPTEGR